MFWNFEIQGAQHDSTLYTKKWGFLVTQEKKWGARGYQVKLEHSPTLALNNYYGLNPYTKEN